MPVRSDQDTKDDHRKEDRDWLPHGIKGALQRGMGWVMCTAAGLLSGAPRPMSIPGAIRAAAPRPVLIIAGGASADQPAAAPGSRPPHRPPSRCGSCRTPGTPRAWPPRTGLGKPTLISFLNTALNLATTPVGQGAGHNG